MIFGALLSKKRSSLVFIKGSVDAARYQKVLKEVKITEFLKNGTRQAMEFMEDGAPAHRANSMKQWFDERDVKRFKGWPGNSPDLNPIENLWRQMKHEQRREQATSMAGLKRIA